MAQGPRWAGKQQGCAVTRAVDLTMLLAGAAALLALAGWPPLSEPPVTPDPGAPASFVIPPDALGARNPQLAAMLARAHWQHVKSSRRS